MRTDGWPDSPTVARANDVGSGRRSAPTSRAAASSAVNRSNGSRSGASACAPLLIVAEEPTHHRAAEATEDGAFLRARSTRARRCGDDPIGEPRERHRLEQDPTRSGERGEEQALTAEERGLDPRHHLDVVLDLLLHRDDAAGVD